MTPTTETARASRAKVMIVEDEGLIAADIELRLREAGYDVAVPVDTGRKAVEAVAAERPDLILMDIRLKGDMDGIDTAAIIREQYDLPVLYLTAHTGQDMLERARVTAPFGYLAKPAGYASLPTSIEVALWKHRAECEIRQQRAWLSTVLGNLADGIAVVDQNGLIQFLNPAAEALTGWTADEARGQLLCSVLRLYIPELDRFADDPLPAVFHGGAPQLLASGLQLADKRGHYIPVEGEIAPSGGVGPILGAVVSFRDATARRIEEHEFRQQQKLQAVSCLAAGVAHDLNNALTVIGGYAELLRGELLESHLLPLVEEIGAQTRRAAEVTRRMLAVSGRQADRRHRVNLNSVLTEWRDFFRALLGSHIQLKLGLAPDLLETIGDFGDFEELLANLLANARNALPEGGCVSVTTANVALAGASPGDAYIALSVTDSGIGMEESVAERIFEPFFTTGSLGHGTGLGLFIVHNIVTELGGSIAVDSKPGQGTTFTVYLPCAPQGEPLNPGEKLSKRGEPERRTILLVDADKLERRAIREQLEQHGYEVLGCPDGTSAMAAVRRHQHPISILVTDVHLPGINGFQLANQLSKIAPDLKVVFMSRHGGAFLKAEMGAPGCRFVSKPVVQSDLIREIEAAQALSPCESGRQLLS
ncbi:MAG TPA: response regulator, partial [Bryobacteraceae bacterium]|nr:response regulator [Bryobacteraceae bacterium]